MERIKRVADRTARKDEPAARSLLESAIEVLSARLDSMADGNTEQAPRVVSQRLERPDRIVTPQLAIANVRGIPGICNRGNFQAEIVTVPA